MITDKEGGSSAKPEVSKQSREKRLKHKVSGYKSQSTGKRRSIAGCRLLLRTLLVGKVFKKAFRILELDERKGRWVVEQDFHGNFQVNVTWFFAFFSGFLDWIVLILIWFERSLHSAEVSGQSCPWPLKLMMSQAVEETCIGMDAYG